MIPPEPPRLAGPKGKGRQRHSFDSLPCPEPAGRKSRHTGERPQPQCERVLTDPLTQADCFPPARKTVIKEGIKKIRVYTRQYSYNALIFLPYTPFFSGRLCDTKAFSLRTRCTGCGACTTRALLTAEVNSACAALAARPPEGWPGAPEHWYTVILRQQKQNKALIHGYPYANERKNNALSHASSKGGSRITQRPTYHAPLSCHPFL